MNFPKLKQSSQGYLEPDYSSYLDETQWDVALERMTNCDSSEFSQKLLRQLLPATGLGQDSPIDDINGVIAALSAMQPTDPIEALLIAQMIGCSQQALSLMAKSFTAKTPELEQQLTASSIRLMATNVKQIDALAKYRRNGSQKIHVEHMHIDNNSQAIIGSVTKL